MPQELFEIRFEDGVEGVIDLGHLLSFRGVFEPLRDAACYARVRVDPDPGTVARPNGADPDMPVNVPEVFHAEKPVKPFLSR